MQPLARMARMARFAGGAPGGGAVRRARSGAGAGLRPETAVSGHTRAPWTGAPYP